MGRFVVIVVALCAVVVLGADGPDQRGEPSEGAVNIVPAPPRADAPGRVRRMICAGLSYPRTAERLYAAVAQYLVEAPVEPRDRRMAAVIAPNSSFVFSGALDGYAFKHVKPGQYDRVVILSPSHYAKFRGLSIASVQYYQTPLGYVPLNCPLVRELTRSTLISLQSLSYGKMIQRRDYVPRHEVEHGIEVLLPFLQVQLGQFELLPILVGDFEDHSGKFDVKALDSAARMLREVIDDRTLIVVSTNFTRYGGEYAYEPFRRDILRQIGRLDTEAFELVLNRDCDGLTRYVEETGNKLIGFTTLQLFMRLLPPRLVGTVLGYDTSGRQLGDPTSSVSYATIAFYDPDSPLPEQRPVPVTLDQPEAEEEAAAEPEEAEAPAPEEGEAEHPGEAGAE